MQVEEGGERGQAEKEQAQTPTAAGEMPAQRCRDALPPAPFTPRPLPHTPRQPLPSAASRDAFAAVCSTPICRRSLLPFIPSSQKMMQNVAFSFEMAGVAISPLFARDMRCCCLFACYDRHYWLHAIMFYGAQPGSFESI